MPQAAQDTRRFSVHARHVDKHHARVVEEDSFEAAAVAYIEHFSPVMSLQDEPADISLIVRDLGSGHEHCFTVNLDSGETTSCG
jgi:Family of unknown function (DUF5961)